MRGKEASGLVFYREVVQDLPCRWSSAMIMLFVSYEHRVSISGMTVGEKPGKVVPNLLILRDDDDLIFNLLKYFPYLFFYRTSRSSNNIFRAAVYSSHRSRVFQAVEH